MSNNNNNNNNNVRAKYFVFTINNPKELIQAWEIKDCEYCIYQEEMGEQGTPHLQGYIVFSQRKRITTIRNENDFLRRAHFAIARGTPQQNYAYCTKEPRMSGPYEFGTLPTTTQGKRNDILKLRDELKKGKRFLELTEDDETCLPVAKYIKFVDRYEQETMVHPDRSDRKVIFHYGPAGTGKTHCCTHNKDKNDVYFYDPDLGGYWEGYRGQNTLIFDEFTGHTMRPTTLNRVLDVYPFTVNIKGRSAPMRSKDIHITSNYLPSRWWKEGTRYSQDALYRRIQEVHYHYAYQRMRVYKSDETQYAMDKLVTYLNSQNYNNDNSDTVVVTAN